MELSEFFSLMNAHPWAYVALLFNFGVVFINGWTDAPNCIATCVTTRCLEPKKAIVMAAIGNLIGTILIGFLAKYLSGITGDVSTTIAGIVDLSSFPLDHALIAVSFGLLGNILFSLGCTYYGFPSSQSNALVGGLTGGAMALAALSGNGNWFAPVGWASWEKVLIGFFGSIALGFVLGYGLTYLIQLICRHLKKGETTRFFAHGQIVASGLMSIAHGVQDGAKFIGVNIVIAAMLQNPADASALSEDVALLLGKWWVVLPIAFFITCGTLVGGKSIIKTMGSGMAKLDKYRGFATDIAAFLGLMLATLFGLPVSSGTVKATAIMGCGAAKSFRQVRWGKAGEMVFSWILIFPGTAIIAFVLTLIFASIFK
jgi:PiT family inorganic phosphate transporter